MENEWKEFNPLDLPPDMLQGIYEWEYLHPRDNEWCEAWQHLDVIIEMAWKKASSFRYRKRQPEPPSHEEIMTKWWKFTKIGDWLQVSSYNMGAYMFMGANAQMHVAIIRKEAEDFVGIESADIPPEG